MACGIMSLLVRVSPYKDVIVIIVLIGVSFAILGFQVNNAGLEHSNEFLYVESVRAMIERGDWLTPYYRGSPRLNKPILFYWLILFSYWVGGISLHAARLCSVSFGVLGIVLTYLSGAVLFSRRSGLVAAFIVMSSWGYLLYARYAMPDMVLTALITLSMYCLIRILYSPERHQKWIVTFYLVIGLATMTKGPPALLPILIGLVFLIWTRQTHKMGWLRSPLGWGVYLGIVVPWYVYIGIQHSSLLFNALYREVMARGLGQLGDAEPFWYFVPLIFGYFFPWSILFPAVIGQYRWWEVGMPKAPHAGRLVLCWFTVIVIVFSIVRGKNPQYILPVAIPLALLIGHTWTRFLPPSLSGLPRSLQWSLYTLVAITAVVAVLLALFIHRFPDSLGAMGLYMYVAIVGMCAVGLMWSVCSRRYQMILGVLSVTIWLVWLVFLGHALPRLDFAPGERFAKVLHEQSLAEDRVGSMRIAESTLVFLLQRPVASLRRLAHVQTFLKAPGRAFVVMREADRQMIARQSDEPFYTISTIKRFREMSLKDIIEAWRNRLSLMETLVVVSNEKPS